jgi:hypothetical protein
MTMDVRTITKLSAGAITMVALVQGCQFTEQNPRHCNNNDGDEYCNREIGDGLTVLYCEQGTPPCRTPESEYGCVEQRPADACYSPCGGRSTIDENGECVMVEDSSTGTSTGDTDTNDTGSTTDGESSSTTGPMPCVSDEECTDADAPFCGTVGECGPCSGTMDPDASCLDADPLLPLCVGDTCVACTPENPLVCDEQLLLCDGTTNACIPCSEHAQCSSGACELAAGTCFPEDFVVHVDGDGGQDHTNVAMAVAAVPGVHGVIIVHEQDSGLGYPTVLIDNDKTIALLAAPGEAPIIQGTGGNPGLAVQGAGTILYMNGLEVSLSAMSAVGLRVDDAFVWVDRSRITQNSGGGILAENGAQLTVRNCFVGGNGAGLAGSYGIDVAGSDVRILYTTVARNDEAAIDSIRCMDSTVDVRNSIVVGRDADSIECPNIVVSNSALDETIGANPNVGAANIAWFVDATNDFHLTPAGAKVFADIAEWTLGDPPTDIDGDLRPTDDASPDFAGADRIP